MSDQKIAILGAGIAGISAAYHLSLKNYKPILYEKESEWGGMCNGFEIGGFRFDNAIHLSFTNDSYVKELFSKSSEYITHRPESSNFYKNLWLRHPVQNNLKTLPFVLKLRIIFSFLFKNKYKEKSQRNYDGWLKYNYGTFFSKIFPGQYTKKYWTVPPEVLSTTWVGNRLSRPSFKELITGAFKHHTKNHFYASEMRYPEKGGYKSFLKSFVNEAQIVTDVQIESIDPKKKLIRFRNHAPYEFDRIISTIPLPELVRLLTDVPLEIREAANKLFYTSVTLVSVGLNKKHEIGELWFYIYDEDILAARCYSPSMKSPNNAPEGMSSFQFEIYHSSAKPIQMSEYELLEHILEKAQNSLKIFRREDVVAADVRTKKYANVVFDHEYEKSIAVVNDYLNKVGILTAGRYGEWKYFWSDQSLLSGKRVVDENFG